MIKINTYWICLVLLWVSDISLSAQESDDDNLLFNGSFEMVYETPYNQGQINLAKGWSRPAKGLGYSVNSSFEFCTPDLLSLNSNNPNFYPINELGILVTPQEGVNFSLIANQLNPYFIDSCFAREYIQGKLKRPLINNKKYKVSFWVSLSTIKCDQVTDKLSLLFTSDSLTENSDLCIYKPQIITNTFFNRNDEWQFFETEYIANGFEKNFSIGIFLANNKIQMINNPFCDWPFGPTWNLVYLLDNIKIICIEPNGCDVISTSENINTQKLTVFPNPASQQVNLTFSEPVNKAIFYSITDLQGRQLLQGSIQNQETVLDISNLSKGIYLLNISDAQGNKWNKKIVKGE